MSFLNYKHINKERALILQHTFQAQTPAFKKVNALLRPILSVLSVKSVLVLIFIFTALFFYIA